MSKQVSHLRQVIAELVDRYGANDADVLALQEELKTLESIEFSRLHRLRSRPGKAGFQTHARTLYVAYSAALH